VFLERPTAVSVEASTLNLGREMAIINVKFRGYFRKFRENSLKYVKKSDISVFYAE
jgi:hypothetical protein